MADEADQVVADPDRIEQVVENLFANALRYTPSGGRIELRADGEGDAIVLSVVDSGRGSRPIMCRSCSIGSTRPIRHAQRERARQRSRSLDREGDRRTASRIDRRDQRARTHGVHDRAAAPVSRAASSFDVDELVADAPGGEDQLGSLRVVLDLSPQPADAPCPTVRSVT